MRSRLAVWAGMGVLVAGGWAAFAYVASPELFMNIVRTPLVQAALYVSCPIAYAGRYYPIQLAWVLLANAATYAAIGLILEVFRLRSKTTLPA